MKNHRYTIAIFAFLLISSLKASASEPVSSGPEASSSAVAAHKTLAWSEKMQSLYRTLSSLMTDVSSDERFKNPKHRSEIEANAKKLADLAHDLNGKNVAAPDKDPSIAIFSSLFADGAKLAYRSLKAGHVEYSRELLRSIPGYCIACHTRNHSGPDFTSLPLDPVVSDLRASERGEFFAATRQYDRALREFDTVISDENIASGRPIEWTHALKDALGIAVRVKQDPKLSRTIVEKLIKSPGAPFFMKEDATHWLESIDAWSKEPLRATTSEEGLYEEAVRLLGQAHELQKFTVDHSADILYLRASAAIHNLLQIGPNGRHAGEAYLMAGLCYEVLSSFRIGEIQDIYYEACVRTNPHTPLAQACYHRYQESIYFGFTGSGGTYLPQDEKDKLKKLEEMATPATKPGKTQI